jgi:hypothetical protein
VLLAALHLACVAAMAGLSWTVQLTTYPAFRAVAPERWQEHHARHSSAMVRLVALPWLGQGATSLLLLLDPPGPLWLSSLAAALGLATVVVTVAWSVPCHSALADAYDDEVVDRLLRSHRWRTALWTAGTAVALALVLAAGP